MYHSIQRLKKLPPELTVYPAHGAGSMCGKSLRAETKTSIGEQLEVNYALKIDDVDTFVEKISENQETPPKYFLVDVELNKSGKITPVNEILNKVKKVGADQLKREFQDHNSFNLVDTRSPADFAKSFFPGFINISLDGRFAPWAGALINQNKPIVVICHQDRYEEALVRFARVGLDHVIAYCPVEDIPMDYLSDQIPQIDPAKAKEMQKGDLNILDVRTPLERLNNGKVETSVHVELVSVEEKVDSDLFKKEAPIMTYCQGGYRSIIADSILKQKGYQDVYDLNGGFFSWNSSGSSCS